MEDAREKRNRKARERREATRNEAKFVGINNDFLRQRIPDQVRKNVLNRLSSNCLYCGSSPNDSETAFHLDHFIPVTRGGSNLESNLFPACKRCNLEKTNHHPVDYLMFKFLRSGILTPSSIGILQSISDGTFKVPISPSNKRWWNERNQTLQDLLEFVTFESELNDSSVISFKEKSQIVVEKTWGGRNWGEKLLEVDTYFISKRGPNTKIVEKRPSITTSNLRMTKGQLIIEKIPCLIGTFENYSKNRKPSGFDLELFGTQGKHIQSISMKDRPGNEEQSLRLSDWKALETRRGFLATDLWFSLIVRTEESEGHQNEFYGWKRVKGGRYIREVTDSKIVIFLPRYFTISRL